MANMVRDAGFVLLFLLFCLRFAFTHANPYNLNGNKTYVRFKPSNETLQNVCKSSSRFTMGNRSRSTALISPRYLPNRDARGARATEWIPSRWILALLRNIGQHQTILSCPRNQVQIAGYRSFLMRLGHTAVLQTSLEVGISPVLFPFYCRLVLLCRTRRVPLGLLVHLFFGGSARMDVRDWD